MRKVTIDAGSATLEVAVTGDIAVIGKEPHAANVELLKVNKFDIEDEESCCICSSSSLSKSMSLSKPTSKSKSKWGLKRYI